jgi:hypothetical protein
LGIERSDAGCNRNAITGTADLNPFRGAYPLFER